MTRTLVPTLTAVLLVVIGARVETTAIARDVAGSFPPDSADDGDRRAKLARSIANRVRTLHDARAQLVAAQLESAEEEATLRESIARLERQKIELAAEISETSAALDTERNRVRELAAQRASSAEHRTRIVTPILAAIPELLTNIRGGVSALRTERIATLEHVRSTLQDRSTSKVGIDGFLEFVAEELTFLRRRELRNERVPLPPKENAAPADGRAVHAWILRLGGVVELFVTEDGASVGVGPSQTTTGARFDPAPDSSARDAIREAIDIVRGRRGPRLVPIPVKVSVPTTVTVPPEAAGPTESGRK